MYTLDEVGAGGFARIIGINPTEFKTFLEESFPRHALEFHTVDQWIELGVGFYFIDQQRAAAHSIFMMNNFG